MITIGATSLGWGKVSLSEVFTNLAAIGAEGVEINGRPGAHGGLTLDEESAPRVKTWAADAGLRITSVSGYNDFAQTDREVLRHEVDRLLTSCRAAAALGVTIVRAFTGDPKPGITLENAWPAFRWGLEMALQESEQYGVTLAIENHGRLLNDGPILARLLREINSPRLRVTLDTGNFAWAGHDATQVRADYDAVLPETVNLHIKDGRWQDGGFVFLPAGEGELPLEDVIGRLLARGFDGPILSEYEGGGDYGDGTRASIAYLKEVVGKLAAR